MDALLRIFRGDREGGAFHDYTVPQQEGMVVLDAVHYVQAKLASDLACAGTQGRQVRVVHAEVKRQAKLMCMTRMDRFPEGQPINHAPMKTFPLIKDLVTDVSWNYEINKRIRPLRPKAPEAGRTWRMQQDDIDASRSSASASSAFSARTSATCCATTTSSTASSARAS